MNINNIEYYNCKIYNYYNDRLYKHDNCRKCELQNM